MIMGWSAQRLDANLLGNPMTAALSLHQTWLHPSLAGRAAEDLSEVEQRRRFRALFDASYDFVYRVLRRCGLDAAAAEDGAQQVFLVALRRLDEIEPGKERSFLYGTAVWVAVRVRQQHARRRHHARECQRVAEVDVAPAVDDLLDQKQRRELLDRVLSEMEEDLRVVIVLTEIEGLARRELARALAIPEGTVASRLRRAREDFHARLGRHVTRRAATGCVRLRTVL